MRRYNMYKHYIETNENNEIIEAYSSAYKEPNDDTILYTESDIRQFHIQIKDINGLYINRYVNEDIELIPENERGTVEQRAEIEKAKVIQKRISLFENNTNLLLLDKLYDVFKAGGDATAETLADWVAEVDKIKAENPLP